MEPQEIKELPVIMIRPATIFAFIKIVPFIILAILFLLIAYRYFPALICLSVISTVFAFYRFMYIRKIEYIITPEIVRLRRGIFFKRTDTVEMYRIKDYIITQPFIFQLFKLMDLTLKTTDPENPILWLRGIPLSDLTDTIRTHVQDARQHNRIYEIN
jgi:uncharacterized membrane protein YdbT with pleckstrin-like domain